MHDELTLDDLTTLILLQAKLIGLRNQIAVRDAEHVMRS